MLGAIPANAVAQAKPKVAPRRHGLWLECNKRFDRAEIEAGVLKPERVMARRQSNSDLGEDVGLRSKQFGTDHGRGVKLMSKTGLLVLE